MDPITVGITTGAAIVFGGAAVILGGREPRPLPLRVRRRRRRR